MTRDRGPLVALLGANAVSITGNILTLLAVPWFVLQTTGSVTKTGLVGGASTLPIALSAAFSGTLADRLGHRRASLASDLGSAVIVGLVPLLYATVGIEFWQLVVLVFLRSLLATPGETARGALLPELAEVAGTPLERATSAYDAMARGARMVGAPVAGMLIAAFGAPNLLVLDALTFAVSALIVGRYVPAPTAAPRERSRYLADLRGGLAYVRRDPLVRNVILLCMATNLLDAGMGAVFLPVYADRVLDSSVGLGVLVGVAGGMAVLGALTFGAVGARLPRRPTFVVAYTLGGLPRFAVMAIAAPFPVVVAVTALSGFAAGTLNPIMDTALFERLPAGLRARVFGVVYAGCVAAVPLGGLTAGAAVAGVGLPNALWAFGLAYLAVTLTPAFLPSWAGLDRQRPLPPAAVALTSGASHLG